MSEMFSITEQRAAIKRSAVLYIGYISEGVEGDYLRQQIHNQIVHIFERLGISDEVDELLHNLDRIGLTAEAITECKYRQVMRVYYGGLLTDALIELTGENLNAKDIHN